MRTKTQLSDFTFRICGYGQYKVTYISPATGKEWSARVTDMTVIDSTKNADEPKLKSLD